MATMADIRAGLAANLRAALPITEGQVSAYLLDNPTTAALQVAGFEAVDYLLNFGAGADLSIVVEGCAGAVSDIGSQQRFDRWLMPEGDESVREAIEADDRLTSRLQDNGTVLADQPAACDSLQVLRFDGYRKTLLSNGAEVLLGDWVVQVITSG